MKMRKWLCAGLSIGMLAALTACGGSTTGDAAGSGSSDSGTYSLSISCDAPTESITGTIVTEFKRLVEEKSDGAIHVDAYTAGQLGSDKEVMENIVSGQIEMGVSNSANHTTDIPAAYVFDMPALFDTIELGRATFDDPELRSLLNSKYEEKGIKLLMIGDQAYRETTSNTPLRTKEDFKNLNIRTMTNDIHVAFWKALGANPTPMNRSDVFLALQQGLLDAQEDSYVQNLLNKYAEVQKYNCATNHIYNNITMVCNKDFYDSLPKEYQDLIDEVSDELLTLCRDMADESVDSSIQALTDAGMEFVEPDEATYEWMAEVAEADVWPLVREKAGADVVDAVIAARDRAAN
ncbi:MAG: TRAP transporter substrate-binding protein DctP [Eubacteriales bacterium]|nr:TRAP transporter substrate-binding protein DctP [Eubacteriales bacterium]